MDTEKRAVVLACVTMQFECDRIIKVAKQIADDTDCELRCSLYLNLRTITPKQRGRLNI